MNTDKKIIIKTVESVADIGRKKWDSLANPNSSDELDFPYNPFLRFDYFNALEQSNSANRGTGWMGQHLVLEDETNGNVLGILPCYLKNHSQGEYIFDHGWADAFERAGGDYYPKLQCTVPFTPASGRRILVGNGDDANERRLIMAGGLQQVCTQLGVSSAHITFTEESEYEALGEAGFLQRTDQQFHWQNNEYSSFDGFLADLSSRKRKNIKKERASALRDNDITIEWLTGSDITEEIWDQFYQFYIDTGARKWGQPYLTRQFYSMIGETMADDILLILAKREGRYVAGAINFIGSHTLYGRHWGCVEDHPLLHFEICYYQAIDFAIAKGLARVEAGAQGVHKLSRGYMPQFTYSAHFITHPGFRDAVENYLQQERQSVAHESKIIAQHGPFKTQDNDNS